ncbi:MAG TPA: GntR family transcriptional regulator [Gemmatimonadaceae bacterium]|nr:GntR family transcriptional regulator [Gemmatimonadaceae bacterium]
MRLRLDPDSPLPLYAQLDRAIRAAIAAGTLRAGDQLPTVRQMAVDLRINANTVARVYAELERAGVLATQRGVGTFVRDPGAIARPARDRERQLRSLADRFLADAAAIGLSLPEVIRHLQARSQETR